VLSRRSDAPPARVAHPDIAGGMRRRRRVGRAASLVLAVGAVLLAAGCCVAQLLPHQRLGVAPNTPPAELKRAYRKRCLELHPDKHKGEANKAWAEQEFMALGKAYETMLADAVRRHQGAGSRPTRAGAGGGGDGERGDQQQQSRQRPDDSRQTAADRERAERHRREQERRAQRRESAKGGARDRGDGRWSERTKAETRRQREREREFRRLQVTAFWGCCEGCPSGFVRLGSAAQVLSGVHCLGPVEQEEERRWQEQARRRQEQHQQRQQQQQQHHFFRRDGEDPQVW